MYRLGQVNFSAKNCDFDFQQEVAKLFCLSDIASEQPAVDISADNVAQVIVQVLQNHHDCLWIYGASLLTPNNRKVLLLGASNTGKSTLALPLAYTHGWKIFGEDVTLIDLQKNELIPVYAPFFLKPGAAELMSEVVDEALPRSWASSVPLTVTARHESSFDIVVTLTSTIGTNALAVAEGSTDTLIRKLAPRSNLLRLQIDIERVSMFFSSSRYYEFAGGSLANRVDTLCALAHCL